MSKTITARWILPISSPPISHGVIEITENMITSVRPKKNFEKLEIDERSVVIPLLVNAHTHLDLDSQSAPDTFPDWLRAVVASRKEIDEEACIRKNIESLVNFGTGYVGDISATGKSYDLLKTSSLSAVVFHEVLGLKRERAEAQRSAAVRWLQCDESMNKVEKALSPHAPYSTAEETFSWAADTGRSLAIHLAETEDELLLLKEQSGELKRFLEEIGAWEGGKTVPSVDKVLELTKNAKSLLLVHGNYLSDEQIGKLSPNTSIVFCPRTHERFRHKSYPLKEFFKAGVRVCLGTDSLASSPDLDLLKEISCVRKLFPEIHPETVLKMGTLWGTEALGFRNFQGFTENAKGRFLKLTYSSPQTDFSSLLHEEPITREIFDFSGFC